MDQFAYMKLHKYTTKSFMWRQKRLSLLRYSSVHNDFSFLSPPLHGWDIADTA